MNAQPRSFRDALGQFPTGVALVTARTPGEQPLGLTISSFNSVSLDPPLVLFSVDRKALSLKRLLEASGFVINILAREHKHISSAFSRPLEKDWSRINYRMNEFTAPLINDALAHFECEHYAQHDGGDHVIVVGRVVNFSHRPSGSPLVFFRGQYRDIHP
ncbi:flavin reductase family protein [Bradyrhizobium sp. Arg237L]|uniref:flavin reductase family protein n=1 Tax=Bradyrhizobium sp. Arg237L TaxID=3003352 RepID=UPI00249F2406|nr:flavin reductase family protein [Bradyrhizobium sp. Arg237L]MDI4237111.1 flavin reductase family protein [Bradyrhizobium sp. Arg237L]